ncbi:hypothetical protein [Paraflavitalea speifideaquila]|uniref:hypothetical protein n=1 Tax=Paraflavitalea speifideaquila TaxID=3076558 RepID=UPI0028EAA730|nr:hypothetical protein [Paraflavitalea speifideiaquila]
MRLLKAGGQSCPKGCKNIDEQLSEAFKKNTINEQTLHKLRTIYKDDPEGLAQALEEYADNRRLALLYCSWETLDRQGLLEELKERDLEGFKAKYKQTFNRDYKS